MEIPDNLSDTEKRLVSACVAGRVAEFSSEAPRKPSEENQIRSSLIRFLLICDDRTLKVDPKGVLIKGAWIEGALDLHQCNCRRQLRIEQSTILKPIDARGCRIPALSMNGSIVNQLDAAAAKIGGDVTLRNGFESQRSIVLTQSKISGGLFLDGATLGHASQISISLERAEIAGDVLMGSADLRNEIEPEDRAIACGSILLREAKIGGSLLFHGIAVHPERGDTVSAQGAKVSGSVRISSSELSGRVDLNSCTISGQLALLKSKLSSSSGVALALSWVDLGGSLTLRYSEILGGISLNSAKVGAQFSALGGVISGTACSLSGTSASVAGSLIIKQARIVGAVVLSHIRVGGTFELDSTSIASASAGIESSSEYQGAALIGEAMRIQGSLFFRNSFSAIGRVSLANSLIGANAELRNAEFSLAEPLAASWKQMGSNAQALSLTHRAALLHASESELVALNMESMSIEAGFWFRDVTIRTGAFGVSGTSARSLCDDRESWPADGWYFIDGLSFEAAPLDPLDEAPLARRLEWIERSALGTFHSQPYRNLADIYRGKDDDHNAEEVLIVKERRWRNLRRTNLRQRLGLFGLILAAFSWLGDRVLLDMAVGYGFRSARVAFLALGVTAFLTVVYQVLWQHGDIVPSSPIVILSGDWTAAANDDGIKAPAAVWSSPTGAGKDYETFNPLIHAADVFIPLVALGQDNAWSVSTSRSKLGRVWHSIEWIFRLAGWVIGGLLLASVTGVLKKN